MKTATSNMSFLEKSILGNNSSPLPGAPAPAPGRPLSNDQNPYLTLRPAGPPSLPLKQEEGDYNSRRSQHFFHKNEVKIIEELFDPF